MALNPSHSCNVCGSVAVQVDEVFDAGRLILSECSRCRHRWTSASSQEPVRSATVRVRRVAAEYGTGFANGARANLGTDARIPAVALAS